MALTENKGVFKKTFEGMVEGVTTLVSGTNEIFQNLLNNDNNLKSRELINLSGGDTDIQNMQDQELLLGKVYLDSNTGKPYKCIKAGAALLTPNSEYVVEITNANLLDYADRLTFDTIAELQADPNLANGDVVEVLGYYAKGDGAGHKRIVSNTDDGSGVPVGSLFANLLHSDNINVKYFGAVDSTTVDSSIFINKAVLYADSLNVSANQYRDRQVATICTDSLSVYYCSNIIRIEKSNIDFKGTLYFRNQTSEESITIGKINTLYKNRKIYIKSVINLTPNFALKSVGIKLINLVYCDVNIGYVESFYNNLYCHADWGFAWNEFNIGALRGGVNQLRVEQFNNGIEPWFNGNRFNKISFADQDGSNPFETTVDYSTIDLKMVTMKSNNHANTIQAIFFNSIDIEFYEYNTVECFGLDDNSGIIFNDVYIDNILHTKTNAVTLFRMNECSNIIFESRYASDPHLKGYKYIITGDLVPFFGHNKRTVVSKEFKINGYQYLPLNNADDFSILGMDFIRYGDSKSNYIHSDSGGITEKGVNIGVLNKPNIILDIEKDCVYEITNTEIPYIMVLYDDIGNSLNGSGLALPSGATRYFTQSGRDSTNISDIGGFGIGYKINIGKENSLFSFDENVVKARIIFDSGELKSFVVRKSTYMKQRIEAVNISSELSNYNKTMIAVPTIGKWNKGEMFGLDNDNLCMCTATGEFGTATIPTFSTFAKL